MTEKTKKRLATVRACAGALGLVIGVGGVLLLKKKNSNLSSKNEELTRVNHLLSKRLNEAYYHLGKMSQKKAEH